jgi:hypothetical protein
MLSAPHGITPESHRETDSQGPRVNWPHRSAEPEQGERLTSGISPSARSPATRLAPVDSPQPCELKEVVSGARGGAEQAQRWPWQRRWRGSPTPDRSRPWQGPRRGVWVPVSGGGRGAHGEEKNAMTGRGDRWESWWLAHRWGGRWPNRPLTLPRWASNGFAR